MAYERVVEAPRLGDVMQAQDSQIKRLQRERQIQNDAALRQYVAEQEKEAKKNQEVAGYIGLGAGLILSGNDGSKKSSDATSKPATSTGAPATQTGAGGLQGNSQYLSPPARQGAQGQMDFQGIPGAPGSGPDAPQQKFMGLSSDRWRSGIMGAQIATGDYRGAGNTMNEGLADRRRKTPGVLDSFANSPEVPGYTKVPDGKGGVGYRPEREGVEAKNKREATKRNVLVEKEKKIKAQKDELSITTRVAKERTEIRSLLAKSDALKKTKAVDEKRVASTADAKPKWSTAQEADLRETKNKLAMALEGLESTIQPTNKTGQGVDFIEPGYEEWLRHQGPKKVQDKLLLEALRERASSELLGTSTSKGQTGGAARPAQKQASGTPAGRSPKPGKSKGHITLGDNQRQEVSVGDSFTLKDGRKVRVRGFKPDGEAELEVLK